jgi:MFS family permease
LTAHPESNLQGARNICAHASKAHRNAGQSRLFMSASRPSTAMLPAERRASASLASIFAMRMLGLFLVLPVFALEATKYPGGDDPAFVGLAMGIYGLTQGILQIPFGMASDRFGRKKVILFGLVIFALGSFLAASATTLNMLIAGRALQGAGAISAAVTALLADMTRDEVRTKAMALVGASIGLMFALSLVLAPWLATQIGLSGLFALTGVLVIACMATVIWAVPPEPALTSSPKHTGYQRLNGLKEVLTHADLLRLDLGAFILHAVQLAMWVAIPAMLVQAGLAKASHWQAYLPAVLLSFVFMGGLFMLEARGQLKLAFLGSVTLVGMVQLGLWWALPAADGQAPSVWLLSLLLFVFFVGFNILEASQPSLASRVAPAHARGAALGVYNTVQSLGFFVGGFGGGWLAKHHGFGALFAGCFVLMMAWLVAAWGMKPPAKTR